MARHDDMVSILTGYFEALTAVTPPVGLADSYFGVSQTVTYRPVEPPPEPAPEVPYILRAQLGPVSIELPITLQAMT